MITEEKLRAAATELNKVTKVQPALRVKATFDALLKEVKESIDPKDEGYILQPSDEFSAATQAVFDEILGKTPAKDEDDDEQEDAPEDVQETQEEVAEKLHKENIADAPINKGKKAPAEKKEPAPPAEKKAKEKPVKEKPAKTTAPAITKKSIIIDMTGSAKGSTIEEMAQAMVDKGVDPDFKKNCVVTKLWLAKMGFNTRKEAIEKDPRFKR